ncbi:TonB-dependent receptor [Henriciella aquimarina]|uniref:TonB-dependent receptor n=1 Tax=Henriciella aquimarina TaxID=545261 RepID=UPI0009FDE9B3|nr:TonB-dependent receptor [Henriciella aquimarina]
MTSNVKFRSSVAVLAILGGMAGPWAAAQETSDNEGRLDTVVVTAQRRAESVQKAALSIEVLGEDQLERRGVTEPADLTKLTPSITVAQNGVYPQTIIRGAGDNTANGLAPTAVSYSVDGVVTGQALGVSQNFYDLERVEILKGPQGTLYGRNATGGAVNLITKRPSQEFEGYLTGEYGNFDNKRLTGALNIPLSNTLAIRGAFNLVDRDGYLSDGTDDDVRQSARLQALWQPNEVFNLRVMGDYSHTGGKGGGAVLFPRQPGTDEWDALSHPINNEAITSANFGLHVPFLSDSYMDLDQWDIMAEANIELGDFATLTLIPGYRDIKLDHRTYNFGLRATTDPQTHEQTTFEARLSNQTDRLKWVLGAYYYKENTYFWWDVRALAEPNFITNFNVLNEIKSKNESQAVFGEATYSLTDRFRVIGGLRYTQDEIRKGGSVTDTAVIPAPGSPYIQSGKLEFDDVTWKAGLEFDVSDQSFLYLTASKGYKSGGFFYAPDEGETNSFDPETLHALEFGLRNRFFDNTLQVNIEAFYWEYEDQQVTAVGYTDLGAVAYVTRNAGKAAPRGGSIDVVWKASPDDTLGFAVNYTRARYDEFMIDFPADLAGLLRTGPLCDVGGVMTNEAGNSVLPVDCSGAPLQRTPEWSGTANYEHVFDLGSAGDLRANVNATWATSRYLSSDFYVPVSKTDGYTVFNADLTYTPADSPWSLTLYGRNLTDEAVYQGGIADAVNGFGGPDFPTFYESSINPPLTYGVRATVDF